MTRLLFCLCFVIVRGTEVKETNDPAVQLLQEYLQINTTTGTNQTEAIRFWRRLAEQIDASFYTYNFITGFPIVVLRIKGSNRKLSSICLLSHIDVAPVADESKWKYPPFSGTITKDGVIYGRGVQDCKTVSIQYYEALKNLNNRRVRLQRDVILILFTNHEMGVSLDEIRKFIESQEFADMSIGGGIDEGFTFSSNKLILLYQDKALLVLQVDCYGIEIHGSLMPDTNYTAIGRCAKVIESFQEYRDAQVEYMKQLAVNDTSNFTSINLNRLQGALADNIIPGRVTLRYYINPSINKTVSDVFYELQQRVNKIDGDIKLTIIRSSEKSPAVRLDNSNPYYRAISSAARNLKFEFDPTITFDQTTAGVMRKFGIPILGFSPLPKTDFDDHGYDEILDLQTFLKGIPLYQKCIQNLANLSAGQVRDNTSSYLVNYDKKKYL